MRKRIALLLTVTVLTALLFGTSQSSVVAAATGNHEKVVTTLGFLDLDKAIGTGAQTTKEGNTYGEKFSCTLDSSGEINYLKLVANNMEGPIIMNTSTLASLPLNLSTATYMLNDVSASKSSLRNNDILYYIETLNTVFAYRNKVTGTIENITLSSFYPDTVTIQGKIYSFETEDAAEEFSMYGEYQVGDAVTVLLGKGGQVAGVLDLDETQEEVIGVVTSYKRKASSQSYYSEDYVVTLVDGTGQEQSYSYDGEADEFEAGDLVKVTVKTNSVTVSDYDGVTCKGTVSEDGSLLGSYKFAADASIIDYYSGSYQKIYKSRLKGVTIYESGVLNMKLNEAGEIEQLILNSEASCYPSAFLPELESSLDICRQRGQHV